MVGIRIDYEAFLRCCCVLYAMECLFILGCFIDRIVCNGNTVIVPQRSDIAFVDIGRGISCDGIGHNGSTQCNTGIASRCAHTDSATVVGNLFIAVCQSSHGSIGHYFCPSDGYVGVISNGIGCHVSSQSAAAASSTNSGREAHADIGNPIVRLCLGDEILQAQFAAGDIGFRIGIALNGGNGTTSCQRNSFAGADAGCDPIGTVGDMAFTIGIDRHFPVFLIIFLSINICAFHGSQGVCIESRNGYAALGRSAAATACTDSTAQSEVQEMGLVVRYHLDISFVGSGDGCVIEFGSHMLLIGGTVSDVVVTDGTANGGRWFIPFAHCHSHSPGDGFCASLICGVHVDGFSIGDGRFFLAITHIDNGFSIVGAFVNGASPFDSPIS